MKSTASYLLVCGWLCASSHAVGITDAGFFTDIPHTLITFETDGAGNPVVVADGFALAFPGNEYESLGVIFTPGIRWVNDSGADFEAAQAIGGSLPIGIPGAPIDDFSMSFSVPVRAFGFWVQKAGPVKPVFVAFDDNGDVIESAIFELNFIDGTIGVAQFGFMGILADRNISSVQVTKDAALFDNLHFSPIPEPEPMTLILIGLVVLLGRAVLGGCCGNRPPPRRSHL